jgi:undecaprenyl-diphosphatase
MSIEQIVVLAIVQGITEFLPISSSAHLILVPALTGWPDQGIMTDIMVHVGSLLAVIVYFWRDILNLVRGGIDLLRGRMTEGGRLVLLIVLATIPMVLFGLFLIRFTDYEVYSRDPAIIAWNTILYGILLLIADRVGPKVKTVENMTAGNALVIGVSQALSLLPGTSRSGVTMTAARYLGFTRTEAARFSMLLSIPATIAPAMLLIGDAVEAGEGIVLDDLVAAGLTFVSALLAIAFLMALVRRTSFLPFVLYRMLLGGFLLVLLYT